METSQGGSRSDVLSQLRALVGKRSREPIHAAAVLAQENGDNGIHEKTANYGEDQRANYQAAPVPERRETQETA